MLSIGEFSKVTGLSVKTLRFYQEEGILAPSWIDEQTGYRYYDARKLETARLIAFLRDVEMPIAEIRKIVADGPEGADLIEVLERHQATIAARTKALKRAGKTLAKFIHDTKEARSSMTQSTLSVSEKQIEPMLIAAVRMRGAYSESGAGFAKIGRRFGRYICGPCFLLHYDSEYKEEGADFEACIPIRKGEPVDGVAVRELAGGQFVTLEHLGPYESLGPSYAAAFEYVRARGYAVELPTREVYLKGPGMLLKGNPKKYRTEIQLPIVASGTSSGSLR